MSEDLITKIILALITILAFGIIGILFKKWLDAMEEVLKKEIVVLQTKQTEMNGAAKEAIERHHRCREELPVRFASSEIVGKLFDKIEPIALDVALIKKEIRIKMKMMKAKA